METIAGKTELKLSSLNKKEINMTKNKALQLCKKQVFQMLRCSCCSLKKKHLPAMCTWSACRPWIKSLLHPTLSPNCVFKDFLVAADKDYPGIPEESLWHTCTCNITVSAQLGIETWILLSIWDYLNFMRELTQRVIIGSLAMLWLYCTIHSNQFCERQCTKSI